MAIVFADGGDLYGNNAANIARKWTSTVSLAIGVGRFGGGAIRLDSSNSAVTKSIAALSTFGMGFVINVLAANIGGTTQILQLTDSGTAQLHLDLNASQQLVLVRGVTTLATSAVSLAQNTFYHLELKTTINSSTGSFELRLNGSITPIINVTGANTQSTGNATVNDIRFVTSGSVPDYDLDDVVIWDTTGSSPQNNFMGDIRIETIRPTSAGTNTGWTPNTGSNYDCVDDINPDDDTTYVATSVSTTKDTYTMSNLTSTIGTIFGAQSNLLCKKTDAGTADIKSVVRTGGSNFSSSAMGPSTSYSYVTDIRTLNPNTGVAWTGAEIDASEWGSEFS